MPTIRYVEANSLLLQGFVHDEADASDGSLQVGKAGERVLAALDKAWDIVRLPRQPESPKLRAKLVLDKANNVSMLLLDC